MATRFDPLAEVVLTLANQPISSTGLSSPPMLVTLRGRRWTEQGVSTVYELLDRTSWRLSSGSESFETFIEGTASDIVEAIGERAEVDIGNAPNFLLYREDIKLSTLWDPLRRIAVVGGRTIHIGTSGQLVFCDANWSTTGDPLRPTSVEEGYRPLDRVDRLFVTKTTGIGSPSGPQYFDFTSTGNASGQLHWPIGPGPNIVNEGGVGNVAWVTLWDGDPNAGGRALAIRPLNGDQVDGISVPINGDWPATHFTALVYPDLISNLPTNARLRIDGTPHSDLPAGIDGAIAKSYGTGRGAVSTFSESMIPSVAHADSHWQYWLAEANRGTNYLTARGPLQLGAAVGNYFSWTPLGLGGRIEQVTHSGGGSVPTTEIVVNCDLAA